MRPIEKIMPKDHNLFLCGDTHHGSILTHKAGIRKLKNEVLSGCEGLPVSKNFIVHHGDIIEGILMDDRRYDGRTTAGDIDKEIENAVKTWKPVAHKMLVMLDGNHPKKLWRTHPNVTRKICKKLKVPFGSSETRFTYRHKDGRLMYKHLAVHGRKTITSTADDMKRRRTNKELVLKRHLKELSGDCILNSKGHTHQLLLCRPIDWNFIYTDTKGRLQEGVTGTSHTMRWIHPDHRWYVNTGGFYMSRDNTASFESTDKDVYSSYVEDAEYPPTDLGYAVVMVRDGEIRDIKLRKV